MTIWKSSEQLIKNLLDGMPVKVKFPAQCRTYRQVMKFPQKVSRQRCETGWRSTLIDLWDDSQPILPAKVGSVLLLGIFQRNGSVPITYLSPEDGQLISTACAMKVRVRLFRNQSPIEGKSATTNVVARLMIQVWILQHKLSF